MLEHQKLILAEVSNDRATFRKEIIKSFKWLKSYEIIHLRKWLNENYGKLYAETIKEVFKYIAA